MILIIKIYLYVNINIQILSIHTYVCIINSIQYFQFLVKAIKSTNLFHSAAATIHTHTHTHTHTDTCPRLQCSQKVCIACPCWRHLIDFNARQLQQLHRQLQFRPQFPFQFRFCCRFWARTISHPHESKSNIPDNQAREEGGEPEIATKSQHALLLMKTLIVIGCGSDLVNNYCFYF